MTTPVYGKGISPTLYRLWWAREQLRTRKWMHPAEREALEKFVDGLQAEVDEFLKVRRTCADTPGRSK